MKIHLVPSQLRCRLSKRFIIKKCTKRLLHIEEHIVSVLDRFTGHRFTPLSMYRLEF